MVLTGQNPYDPKQWLAEHLRLGSSWTPDLIFLYPLPQAFFLVPLALLPPRDSFVLWGIVSQLIVGATCFALLKRTGSAQERRLFAPMVLILLFFGPIYLTLQVGSIGGLTLAALVAGIILVDRERPMLAGIVLSSLILKPPLGLPILGLIGFWRLPRRDTRVILGILAGAAALMLSGLLYDPNWVREFITESAAPATRALGRQSTIWSLASVLCHGASPCSAILGSAVFLTVLAISGWVIWKHGRSLTSWEAFNIIIPISFLSALYAFSYDQIVLVIPIVWICCALVRSTRSYIWTFVWLVFLDTESLVVLWLQARYQTDSWSWLTTAMVLGVNVWLLLRIRRMSQAAEGGA